MTQQIINIGAAANDGTGDQLRTAFDKTNDNFAEVYPALTFNPSGTGAVGRTVQDKLRDTVSVKDMGAICDGVADDTAAIQACCTNGGAYYIPWGSVIRLTSTIAISAPVAFHGDGCVACQDIGDTGNNIRGPGAWFHIDHATIGFNADGTSGAVDGLMLYRFEGCGTFRNQPVPGAGAFTPNANNWDFVFVDCEFQIEDFVCLNPTKFLSASLPRGGRFRLDNIRGQPLQVGIAIDETYDTSQINAVHFWPYWSLHTSVKTYTWANLTALSTGRVDGLVIQRFFTIFANIGWLVTAGAAGSIKRAHCDFIYLDNGTHGLLVDATADDATAHINHLLVYGREDAPSLGFEVSGDRCEFTVGRCDLENFSRQAMFISGVNNHVQLGQASIRRWSKESLATYSGVGVDATNKVIFDGAPRILADGATNLFAGTGLIACPSEWRTYATTFSTGTGAITTMGTTDVRYRVVGDMVDVSFDIRVTTNGTGAASFRFSLPFQALTAAVGSAREATLSGNMCNVEILPSATLATILTYNNLYPVASGAKLVGSVSYRKIA